MMKLGILYLNKGGGVAQCTYELVRSMSGRADVTCYLASQNVMLDQFKSLPCRVHAFPIARGTKRLLYSLLTGKGNPEVSQTILTESPDLILDTGSVGWGRVVQMQLARKVPIAEIIHDSTAHPGLKSWIEDLPNIICPPMADVLVGMSEFCYRELVRKYPAKQHVKSRHGIILSESRVDLDGVADRRHKLLFFGRINPYKGVEYLVPAFRIARESMPHLELSIVGNGPIKPGLLKEMTCLGIRLVNRYVNEDEIRRFIAESGVMILPYTSATQSGVAAVALGNGLPSIATDVGALPEQVVHGKNGLIVPPRNVEMLAAAMVEIARDRNTAFQMAVEARRIGEEEYSWDKIGDELLNNLQIVLKQR
jgi:glycosyltransferase involved in cell wall biosynthesis